MSSTIFSSFVIYIGRVKPDLISIRLFLREKKVFYVLSPLNKDQENNEVLFLEYNGIAMTIEDHFSLKHT